MSKPASLPGQITLERGRQLSLLRQCRLGDLKKRNDRKPHAKALLRAIDDHIGRNGRWTIHLEQLFEEIEVSRSTGYQWFRWLVDSGLVGCDPQPDGRNELWICWSTVWEFTPEGAAAQSSSPPPGPAVQDLDRQSRIWTDQSSTRTGGPESGLTYKEERPESAPISAPSSSPSARAVDDSPEATAATQQLIELGMNKPAAAVERSLQLRTAGETLAIIEFFAEEFRLPDGRADSENSIAWLFWRLTDPDAKDLPPQKGWKTPSDAFRRAKREIVEAEARERERAAWRAEREILRANK